MSSTQLWMRTADLYRYTANLHTTNQFIVQPQGRTVYDAAQIQDAPHPLTDPPIDHQTHPRGPKWDPRHLSYSSERIEENGHGKVRREDNVCDLEYDPV